METNIHTTTWNFRLLKKLLSQNLVVLVKLIVDGNWIYSFENISSSMFLAHCDTLKKYEHKLRRLGLVFVCESRWLNVLHAWDGAGDDSFCLVWWIFRVEDDVSVDLCQTNFINCCLDRKLLVLMVHDCCSKPHRWQRSEKCDLEWAKW